MGVNERARSEELASVLRQHKEEIKAEQGKCISVFMCTMQLLALAAVLEVEGGISPTLPQLNGSAAQTGNLLH